MARRLRTKLSRALRSASASFSATLDLPRRSWFLARRETYPTSDLQARSIAGRHSRPTRAGSEAGLGLWGCNQPFPDRGLARGLARPAHRFRLLTGFALGGLLIGLALLHLPEDTLALHLLFEHPKGLIDVVVANEYLQRTGPLIGSGKQQ